MCVLEQTMYEEEMGRRLTGGETAKPDHTSNVEAASLHPQENIQVVDGVVVIPLSLQQTHSSHYNARRKLTYIAMWLSLLFRRPLPHRVFFMPFLVTPTKAATKRAARGQQDRTSLVERPERKPENFESAIKKMGAELSRLVLKKKKRLKQLQG